MTTTSTMQIDGIADALIAEAVARQGGYEEVDQNNKWGAVAGALGKKKSHAPAFKARYEDMLKNSVEQDELEDDDMKEEEVEQILDKRTNQGQPEYLVKWKNDDNPDDTSWEPKRNLVGCDELLQEFESRLPKSQREPPAPAAPAPTATQKSASASSAPPTSSASFAAPAAGGGEAGAAGATGGAGVVGADGVVYRRVTGIKRQHDELQGWVVELGEGEEVHVDNATLRAQAPQLLLDFYEARLQFA